MKAINDYAVVWLIILLGVVFALLNYGKVLRNENIAYRNNLSVMMDSAVYYRVADSLNAVQIGQLQLKLSEYKKYRAEDAELIKKLRANKAQVITKTLTETKYLVKTQLKDTVIYKDTLHSINYSSKWIDIKGLINRDTVQLNIANREELMLVESLRPKKFLGIKLPIWLFGYKQVQLDAVSKNPNTSITKIEHVKIR